MDMYQKRKERKKAKSSESVTENTSSINWYPGHMAKTKREIKERINLIDLIYEVIDARMPLSSKMKGMDEIIKDKPCILVMTKKDLCDIEETNKWVLEYEKLGYKTILVDLTNNEDYKKLIKLTNEVVKPIQDKRKEKGLKDKEIKIADMKLYYSSTYRTMITDGTTSRCLDEINKIEYVLVSNPSESRTIELNNETFITEKDLQMTYTEKFKLYGNSNNMDDFPFFYNDGTKCIMVKQALLWIDDGTHYSISFGNDDYNNPILPRYIGSRNTRAQYFTEVLSPDENIRIYNIPHFINNHNINGKTYKCMCLITEGNRYAQDADDHKESFELKCVDLSGKTLLEQDEYGVQMIYEYDINGIMHKKILTNKNDSSQKIVYTTTTSESSQTINDGFVCQKNTYNEQNSSLLQSELYGNDEPSEEKQITNYKYGFFNEELKQVNNEIGGHNFITYGKYGRIVRVTPKKADDNDRYGFKFQYDSFGEPIKFLYSYKTSEGVVDDVLVEKVIDRQNGCVTTRHKRSDEEIDSTTTTIDKYGRIAEMDISGQKVKYTRDSLLESPGAANVNKIEDHVDGTIHNFKYDEDYNLKSYSTIYENGSSLTMEKMSEREITCTETFPSDSNLQDSTSISEINYDENVILSARIKQTNHYMVYGNKGNPIDYEYDALGRINRKQMSIYEGWSTPGTTIAASKEFVDGTNLLKKKTILLDNDWMRDTLFEFSCNYNSKQYLKSRGLKITCKDDIRTYNQTYEYNKANQLVKECNLRTGHEKNYSYNDDGSINSVTSFGLKENYHYQKGRLSSITCEPMLNSISINYDNLGNVTEIGGKNYTWERGNLLKSYKNSDQTTQYFYNGFGKKIKKILPNGTIITYNYDNEKLISENWSTGLKIRYLYDLEGILGFYLEKDGYGSSYFYIKDEQGNVVSILDNDLEIVHYEYDAYGNITIAYSDDDGVAEINPIRWKGLYCETESDLYFINGNTYLPSLRQNLSMNIIEEIVQNSFTINALYPYQITSTNPIELAFSNHNIFSGLDLVYAPPAKSKWSRLWNEFWKSDVGKILAVEITLFACALSIITGTFGCFLIGLAGVGVTLLVGSIISGVIGKKTGKGFWNSFFNYLNDNWAQTLAIEMALFIVSIGVSKLFKGFTDCFIKGTLVLTSIGLLKIEDIKEGDEVWAYNEETGEKALKKVVNLFRKETKEWMHLFVENPISKVTEEIICTPSHRIYIKEKGWLKASEILVNDEVLLYNNNSGIVRKIELEKLEHPEVTYNFEVEDYHNYFVSEESVLVHNDCNPIDSINNCKYKEYANSYDEAMEMAKQKGGVSGNPESAKPNVYGGYDYRFYRKTKQDRDFPVDILEHMTGHPNRKITRHLNVIGVDGKNWHIFF